MSIDALERLIQQMAAQVQILVGPLGQEGKYFDSLEYLYTAFSQGLALVGGLINAAAPINRIPPDLLVSIFALSPGTHSRRSRLPYWPFEEPHVDDLHKLPKVCRYWRELALVTPTLWNTIVTIPHSQGRDSCFGRSIYLPDNLSVDLTVHFNPLMASKHSVKKMTEFILTNAPKIRELHVWDSSSIDPLLFLRSFDASNLEHCTISHDSGIERSVRRPLWMRPVPFFSNGGARLRSLCLSNLRVLPANEFPALTLLKIGSARHTAIPSWDVEDLVRFLAGSPRLEEVYVHDMPYAERLGSHNSPAYPAPVSLPRLQYLTFSYCISTGPYDRINLTDILLSLVSVPPTCHMYLPTPICHLPTCTADILASVCRRVPGKDAVSHMFLRLSEKYSPMQLIFRQGSLRLLPDTDMVIRGDLFDFFDAFSHLFAATKELRIHYSNNLTMTALGRLLSVGLFPNVTTMSVLRDADEWRSTRLGLTLRAGLAHLRSDRSCPTLDTLWTSLESSGDLATLKETLAARVSFGCPIRRLIVSVHYSLPPDSDELAALRALEGIEEVVVMELGVVASSALTEVDWMVRLPERHSLPPSVHRDWPTVWDGKRC